MSVRMRRSGDVRISVRRRSVRMRRRRLRRRVKDQCGEEGEA